MASVPCQWYAMQLPIWNVPYKHNYHYHLQSVNEILVIFLIKLITRIHISGTSIHLPQTYMINTVDVICSLPKTLYVERSLCTYKHNEQAEHTWHGTVAQTYEGEIRIFKELKLNLSSVLNHIAKMDYPW